MEPARVNKDEKVLTYPYPYDENIPQTSFPAYILQSIPKEEDGIACIDAEKKITWKYADIKRLTLDVAKGLQEKYNVDRGQRVAIALPNCLEYPVLVMAVTLCGATATLVNPSYTFRELEHVVSLTRPQLWITSQDISSKLQELFDKSNYYAPSVNIDLGLGVKSLESLSTTDPKKSFQPAQVNPASDIAMIFFSSGTTGLPKGVLLTHLNLIVSQRQNEEVYKNVPGEPTDRITAMLPMFHTFGISSIFGYLVRGIVFIVFSKFSFEIMLQAIQDYKITHLSLVPPIAVGLAKLPVEQAYDLSSIRIILCGAAALSSKVVEKLNEKFNCLVFEGYGMTETTLRTHSNLLGDQRTGSVGIVMPFCQAKVVDPETEKALGANEVGEIWVRGATIMKGYIGDETSTRETVDTQGWLHTGDIGYYDQDGFFYITDRMKELIKYKGFQVPPSELEHILLTNPEIVDAAVVGIPDENAGELPRAYVVKRSSSKITEKDIVNFVAGQVSAYKQLRGGVVFLPEIPKTPSGKILRRELKKLHSKL